MTLNWQSIAKRIPQLGPFLTVNGLSNRDWSAELLFREDGRVTRVAKFYVCYF